MNESYRAWRDEQDKLLRNSGRDAPLVGKNFRQFVSGLVSSQAINRTIEVGACEASFSRWAASQKIPALALEANPYVHEKFSAEVIKSGVDYRHVAAGDGDGVARIRIPLDFRGTDRPKTNQMASLLHNNGTKNFETVEVQCVRLDAIARPQQADRIALWIDVEGASRQVLSGASDTLDRTLFLQIEVETRPFWEGQWLDVDVANFLEIKGFRPAARDIAKANQYNVVFFNPSRIDPKAIGDAAFNYLTSCGAFAPASSRASE